jgi:hypothetical protein
MARRKLEGRLTEYEYEDTIINGHKAEESMEDIYHMLREKYGARHQLTLKAEGAVRRINAFRNKLSKLVDPDQWLD